MRPAHGAAARNIRTRGAAWRDRFEEALALALNGTTPLDSPEMTALTYVPHSLRFRWVAPLPDQEDAYQMTAVYEVKRQLLNGDRFITTRLHGSVGLTGYADGTLDLEDVDFFRSLQPQIALEVAPAVTPEVAA